MFIKMSGEIRYRDILDVLEISSIPDVDHKHEAMIEFDAVHVFADEMVHALGERDLLPEPEKPEVSVRDLRDAFSYLRRGDTALAREMFQRALSECGDDRLMVAIEEICRDFHRAEIHG